MHKKVYALAKKYYGVHKPSVIEAPKPRIEVEQQGPRRIEVYSEAKIPYLLMGFKVPSLVTSEDKDEAYALDMLAGVLDGSSSSRLSNELVRGSEIAASAGAGYNLDARLQTLFLFDGTPSAAHSLVDLEAAYLGAD